MERELSDQEQFRRESLVKLRGMGINPYPAAEYVVNAYSDEVKENFKDDAEPRQVSMAGRLMSRRIMGKASFADLKDSKGRIQGKFRDGEEDVPAHTGKNITITLDIDLQQITERLFAGKIGSAVAIEPCTGEVLAMVSNPAWNPQLLVGKNRSKNYVQLQKDEQEIQNLKSKLAQADENYNSLKMAKMLEITDGDLEVAKARVSKMIRDVNKCISLLSDGK